MGETVTGQRHSLSRRHLLGIEIASQRHDRRGGADRQVVLHPAPVLDPDFKIVDLAF